MRKTFYSRIALGNLNKNRRFFLPYMLSGAGLLAAFFIIRTLALDERLAQVRGGSLLPEIMGLGSWVMVVLTVIMLFYTNSFLMKQRTREFGLYQVLGMEKRHVVKILFFESFFSTLIILLAGLLSGMLFYKLCSLLICKLLKVDSILGIYYLSSGSLLQSAGLFLAIYVLCFLWNTISIGRMKPIEQLRSQETGEKEPKVKLLLLMIGLATLAGGYDIARTSQNPVKAMNLFLVAVILVIIGTYCLFIAGTIAVLKLLKKSKGFYYKPRHMVAVSGLLYRMKQNAVGLASITILACGVLVMLSTTVSLYAGVEDSIDRMYPQDLYVAASIYRAETEGEVQEPVDPAELDRLIKEFADRHQMEIDSIAHQDYLEVSYSYDNGELIPDLAHADQNTAINIVYITQEEYEELTGQKLDLKKHEMAAHRLDSGSYYLDKELKLGDTIYQVKNNLTSFPVSTPMSGAVDTYGIVVADQASLDAIYQIQKEAYDYASDYSHRCAVCFKNLKKDQVLDTDALGELHSSLNNYLTEKGEENLSYSIYTDSRWEMEENMLGLYGSLLFLGLLLGLVFLFATAMIIYYKQISEGYEDRNRFQILTKIGMSSQEVKKTIGSQILLVFFLPLVVTAIHMIVAFPMITRLLKIFFLDNVCLFMGCTVGAYTIFAVIYVVIYSLTARVYYRIVY